MHAQAGRPNARRWARTPWFDLALLLLAAGFVSARPAEVLGQPGQVERHAGVFDPARHRAVFFGGYDGATRRNDAWVLTVADTARWDPLSPAGALPGGRFGHSAVHDPAHDRMVVFGGWGASGALDETWSLALADPPGWTQLLPSGPVPSARPYHSAIHDPVRARMLIFGGEGTASLFNDVWALSLGDTARWEQVLPSGGPPARRRGHSAIYDPPRDRMIVFGGWPPANDVWALSLADTSWKAITPSASGPSPRFGHAAVYDPAGDRMIVFGGSDGNRPLDDVWALSLADPPAWSRILPAGGPPSARFYHAAAYDPASQAMLVFGGFPYAGDATWALSPAPAPTWSPFRPEIQVSAADLALPAVTVGDTVSAAFSIANSGLEALNVTAIEFSGTELPTDELRLDVPPPLRLPWRGAQAYHLFLTPREARAVQDSLVILSNDPTAPRRRVTLGFTALGLEFGTRILGAPDQAPLGAALIAIVTPAAGVRIERGTLFYRVAGTAAPFDSVALTPLATDFIATIPAEAVTERGVEYHVRVENSGFAAFQPPGAPADSLFTQAVAPAASVSAVPRPNSGANFLAGRPIDVDILLPAGAVFVSGRIHHRAGGAGIYASDTLVIRSIPGLPVGTIPAEAVGARGVEYWIEARTLGSDLRFPSLATGHAIVRALVQDMAETSVHPGERYRLLTVPLDFGVDFSGSLDAILTDQFGTYDPVRWRAYLYDPDSLRNFEFSSARSAAFRPSPGRAFWLVTRDPHRVDTGPVEGLSPPTGAAFPIVLAPGWNPVGNPFGFPVAWADVIRNPAAVGDPVAFDPTRGAAGDYADAAPSVLAPFEGYFVENVSAGPETLRVPARAAAVTEAGSAPRAEAAIVASGAVRAGAPESWSLRLEARTDRAADLANEFGVRAGAADESDPFDLRKPPPPPGPWVRLVFANPAWSAMPGAYRRDLRSPSAQGHTWEVEVRSAAAGEPVTLEMRDAVLPPGLLVRILDREVGGFVAALAQPAGVVTAADAPDRGTAGAPLVRYRFLSFGPDRPYRLAIVAGSEAYVSQVQERERVVPERLALEPGAPNPFRSATRIRFGLPRATRVIAEVFSILGERVATLLDGTALEAGRHALIWDGRGARGGRAPSGVYVLRVAAGEEIRSTRLVLVR